MGIRITIRDGRAGREGGEAGVTPDGKGAVLGVVEQDELLDIGDKVKLADGTEVVVIGVSETISATGFEQTVHIGNIPAAP
jgi:hypothetical protein